MRLKLGLTRDSALLWVLAAAAVFAHLKQVGVPPTQWDYQQWMETGTFLAAWLIGKMQTSDLRHSEYGKAKLTPDDYGGPDRPRSAA